MHLLFLIMRWVLTILGSYLCGKAVFKLKLPAILGWLIGGMVLGPCALNLLPQALMDASWYNTIIHVLECCVGLMIGTELVWGEIKKYGKALIITTLSQSIMTFGVVTACFVLVFSMLNIPLYLAFVFGGIALATAPAPALSIVREFKTDGAVTKTLIPMAALDDIVGVIVFFTTIAMVARDLSGGGMPLYFVPVMIFLPLIIGAAIGIPTGFVLKKTTSKGSVIITLILGIILTSVIGILCNTYLMLSPLLNFMLMGMAFSAAFSNVISKEEVEDVAEDFNPILGISMLVVIINLGAPLDYHAILGAGFFTFIYIAARAFGKYFGARIGAKATHMPITVQKYLGFTLLPHSGVSLVFTGIAASMLSSTAPECATIISGTIAAAAIINEIIAVIMAKKGFEWAGELDSVKSLH